MRAAEAPSVLESVFNIYYERIARAIARVIRDPARAEELAVDVFLKFERGCPDRDENVAGWLYRTAVRASLNELRRHSRRSIYEKLFSAGAAVRTPEEIRASGEEQERVRAVLAALRQQQAELLLLRSNELSYSEIAAALKLNPGSVGTLLSRAQQAFRKEYIKRYGNE